MEKVSTTSRLHIGNYHKSEKLSVILSKKINETMIELFE